MLNKRVLSGLLAGLSLAAAAGVVVLRQLPLPAAAQVQEQEQSEHRGYKPSIARKIPEGKNLLALESSPYLLMHADNPVDWYPWGEAAFEKARRENKPIFLSIGYSTCYWCHVMERESFSDPATARLMNKYFVSIKVDREERPDVDDTYMTAVQLMTGRGGWPMTTLLTPELKPFFGGTYLPNDALRQLLTQAGERWNSHRPDLVAFADKVAERMQQVHTVSSDLDGPLPSGELMQRAASALARGYDAENGGFTTGAPKFPEAARLEMLFDYLERTDDEQIRDRLLHTLRAMARGGIHDQVGGGFHRYSTDRTWTVPHFEKMLYNQAQLLHVYARAYALTGEPLYRRIAMDIADYVQREMTAESGLFYSARDSQIDGAEGVTYVWTREQLKNALNDDDYALATKVYDVDGAPNFKNGTYVLRWAHGYRETATQLDMALPALLDSMDAIDAKLLAARDRREQPMLDNKSVSAWNALMIEALTYAGEVLERPEYIDRARRAADALLGTMRDGQGGFLHVARGGKAKLAAYLTDYAATIHALVTLSRVSEEPRWRAEAANLADAMIARLWDRVHGGFFEESPETDNLLVQTKSRFDGAIPSGNSLAVSALTALADSGLQRYAGYAADTLRAYRDDLENRPQALAQMVRGLAAYRQDKLSLTAHADAQPGKLPTTADLVQATARLDGASLITTLTMDQHWHVNANPASLDFLVPTEVSVTDANGRVPGHADYPEGQTMDSGLGQPIAVYAGRVRIPVQLEKQPGDRARVRVHAQACNDSGRCLAPADIEAPIAVEE